VITLVLVAVVAGLPGAVGLFLKPSAHAASALGAVCAVLIALWLVKLLLELEQSDRQLAKATSSSDADTAKQIRALEVAMDLVRERQDAQTRELTEAVAELDVSVAALGAQANVDSQRTEMDREEVARTLVALHEAMTGTPLRG
jgi:hypothetical protein